MHLNALLAMYLLPIDDAFNVKLERTSFLDDEQRSYYSSSLNLVFCCCCVVVLQCFSSFKSVCPSYHNVNCSSYCPSCHQGLSNQRLSKLSLGIVKLEIVKIFVRDCQNSHQVLSKLLLEIDNIEVRDCQKSDLNCQNFKKSQYFSRFCQIFSMSSLSFLSRRLEG